MNRRGFTLIEVLVVAGIAVLLSSLLLANLHGGNRTSDVTRAAQLLTVDLRRAQAFAVSAQREPQCSQNTVPYYGVRVQELSGSAGVYELFADCNRNNRYESGSDVTLEQITLQNVAAVEVTPAPSGGWLEVVYAPPNPDVVIAGSAGNVNFSVRLCHLDGSSLCLSVAGNNKGNVEVAE